jgi:hypothetical protein
MGFEPRDVSAASLRSGGAMAMLAAGISKEQIQMMGRWKSDVVFRYLHPQALPVRDAYATRMLHHGAISFLPPPNPS